MIKTCRAHHAFSLFQSDPYTRRAYEKPRGYAGDAVMLDYIYKPSFKLAKDVEEVFKFTTNSKPARAVQWRKDYFAQQIVAQTEQRERTSVFSLACGHFREAEVISTKLSTASLTVVAVDHDPESLEVIRKDYPYGWIVPERGTVKDALKGRYKSGQYHLAYAAGLYDYLDDAVAAALTAAIFSSLSSGGQLIITNFLEKHPGRSYMEAFMDWNLKLRDEFRIKRIANLIDTRLVANSDYSEDPFGCVGYFAISKA